MGVLARGAFRRRRCLTTAEMLDEIVDACRRRRWPTVMSAMEGRREGGGRGERGVNRNTRLVVVDLIVLFGHEKDATVIVVSAGGMYNTPEAFRSNTKDRMLETVCTVGKCNRADY